MKFFWSIFRRENILSLFAAGIAISILLFDLFLGDVDESISFEAILFILGLICLAQITEREISFRRIEKKLDNQSNSIGTLSSPTFYSVDDVIPFTKLMETSDEIFYTGGHLESFVHSHTHHFEDWLKAGKSIKLILQNPDNKGLSGLAMPCVNYDAKDYQKRIRKSLSNLENIAARCPNTKLGVRLSNISPTQSVAILNGQKGGDFICILHHLPNGVSSTAPFNFLKRDRDEKWFEIFYQRYYQYLWDESEVFIEHPTDVESISSNGS